MIVRRGKAIGDLIRLSRRCCVTAFCGRESDRFERKNGGVTAECGSHDVWYRLDISGALIYKETASRRDFVRR